MAPSRVWIIGAGEECDIVVDQPTVSRRHCRLTCLDGCYSLEDLGSKNGTLVNGRAIDAATDVMQSDRITLGESVVIPWPESEATVDNVRRRVRAGGNEKRATFLLAAVGLATGIIVLAAFGAIMLRKPGTTRKGPAEVAAAQQKTVVRMKPIAPEPTSYAETEPAHGGGEQVPGGESITETSPVRPEDALYCVVIGDEQGAQNFCLGTATAIQPNVLLTTAAIVTAIEMQHDSFPHVFAVAAADRNRKLTVANYKVDSNYERLAHMAAELLAKSNELVDRLGKADEDEAEQLRKQLAKMTEPSREIADGLIGCDLGVLFTSQPMPAVLELSDAKSHEPVELFGLVLPDDDPYFAATTLLAVTRSAGELTNEAAAEYAVVTCVIDQLKFDWSGSPILDADGRVVAVYSRPSVRVQDDSASESIDAPLTSRARLLIEP